MSKLINITFGIALAFLVVGCESSEAKSSGNSTQTQQVEQQTTAQTNQITAEQQYKKLATGALEYIQNAQYGDYQGATFKQMLEKWTNFCASVEWDIVRVTAIDSKKDSGNFMVTAYCEIKDFEATKAYLQSYYTQKGYVDFSFKHIDTFGEDSLNSDLLSFINIDSKLNPLLPGGTNIITEKMNKNQKRKVFDYVKDKIYMPLSQAINESTKIYLAYPFVVVSQCKDDECFQQLGVKESGFVSSYWGLYLFSFAHPHSHSNLSDFKLAFEVNGNKLLVDNFRDSNAKNKLDMQELMFFNKSIDAISVLEDSFIINKNADMYNTPFYKDAVKKAGRMLASPAFKKILYNKQEQEQFFKDFAAEIIKIYSESN